MKPSDYDAMTTAEREVILALIEIRDAIREMTAAIREA